MIGVLRFLRGVYDNPLKVSDRDIDLFLQEATTSDMVNFNTMYLWRLRSLFGDTDVDCTGRHAVRKLESHYGMFTDVCIDVRGKNEERIQWSCLLSVSQY